MELNSSRQALGLSREIINSSRLEAEEILSEGKREAEDIINEGKAEAERIIFETRDVQEKELQKMRQEILESEKKIALACEDGFQKGLQEVLEAFAEFNIERKSILDGLRKQAIEMALDVSKQVVGDAITNNSKNIISEKINDALELVKGHKEISLKVNKNDFEFVQKHFCTFQNVNETINLSIDNTLKEGNFELSVGRCRILANTYLQLEAVIARIKEQVL